MTVVVCVSVRDVGPIALHCSEVREQENTRMISVWDLFLFGFDQALPWSNISSFLEWLLASRNILDTVLYRHSAFFIAV